MCSFPAALPLCFGLPARHYIELTEIDFHCKSCSGGGGGGGNPPPPTPAPPAPPQGDKACSGTCEKRAAPPRAPFLRRGGESGRLRIMSAACCPGQQAGWVGGKHEGRHGYGAGAVVCVCV